MDIQVGAAWGLLKCTHVGPFKIEENEGGGITIERMVHCYVFECECGEKVRMPKSAFPGKRIMRDCGKCGGASRAAACVIAISVPQDLKLEIAELAAKEKCNVSYLWARLARWGLERWEEEHKHKSKTVA